MYSVIIDKKFKDTDAVKALYNSSFPADERIPFDTLADGDDANGDFYSFYDNEELCGIAYIYTDGDLSFLFYLAVSENMRGMGYGSKILSHISELKPGNRIILDIEKTEKTAANYLQRKRRKEFYLRNGYEESGIFYSVFGVDYELLIKNGSIVISELDAINKKLWSKKNGNAEITYRTD